MGHSEVRVVKNIFRGISLGLALLLATVAPSRAQLNAAATWVVVAGTNTLTATVPGVVAQADLVGVPIRFKPVVSNSGASTFNGNSLGGIAILKPTHAGLVALTGQEMLAGQTTELIWDGTEYVCVTCVGSYAQPLPLFRNLRVYNVATSFGDSAPGSPNVQMVLAADSASVSDANGNALSVFSYSCTINISNSAGAGSIDTGTVATSNWYYLWIVYNPTTLTASCLGSLSSTRGGLTLPSGYTFAARVGANFYLTNNSVTGWQRIVQYGRRAQYVTTVSTPTPIYPLITSTWTGSAVAHSITSVVPATAAKISVLLNGASNQAFNSSSSGCGVGPNAVASATAGTTYGFTMQGGGGGALSTLLTMSMLFEFNLEGTSIFNNSLSSGNACTGNVDAQGWEDNL
jgi:hypothetical protein